MNETQYLKGEKIDISILIERTLIKLKLINMV